MATEKDLKLQTIKNLNPELYSKVLNGEVKLQDAYNETKRIQLGLSEFRGKSTKKKELSVDFKRMIDLHNPSIEEVIVELKKAFPFTWKDFIK